MLKGFNELVQIDVLPFCDKRKAKDDNGKPIEVPYLPWAKCKMLLHENGASEVYFVPLKNETGGYLFQSKEVHDKNGRTTGCYFVSVINLCTVDIRDKRRLLLIFHHSTNLYLA